MSAKIHLNIYQILEKNNVILPHLRGGTSIIHNRVWYREIFFFLLEDDKILTVIYSHGLLISTDRLASIRSYDDMPIVSANIYHLFLMLCCLCYVLSYF